MLDLAMGLSRQPDLKYRNMETIAPGWECSPFSATMRNRNVVDDMRLGAATCVCFQGRSPLPSHFPVSASTMGLGIFGHWLREKGPCHDQNEGRCDVTIGCTESSPIHTSSKERRVTMSLLTGLSNSRAIVSVVVYTRPSPIPAKLGFLRLVSLRRYICCPDTAAFVAVLHA